MKNALQYKKRIKQPSSMSASCLLVEAIVACANDLTDSVGTSMLSIIHSFIAVDSVVFITECRSSDERLSVH